MLVLELSLKILFARGHNPIIVLSTFFFLFIPVEVDLKVSIISHLIIEKRPFNIFIYFLVQIIEHGFPCIDESLKRLVLSELYRHQVFESVCSTSSFVRLEVVEHNPKGLTTSEDLVLLLPGFHSGFRDPPSQRTMTYFGESRRDCHV